ncbi:MAG: CoA-acylating methylmalonate-semialdehyde dehydrogenase [Planctomycetes bacterium]|nr:CoA-acylating methylmalonate-semialdehyde dehydrogenase [Planctomycetota bacterium]
MAKELKNYINGKWVVAENSGYLDVENPSTGETLGKVPLSTEAEAGRAVAAAKAAFKGWRDTPVAERAEYMYKMLAIMKENEEELSRTLTSEMGKSIPDARAEMKRTFQNIEAACSAPMLQQGYKMLGCARNIDGEVINLPIGVFVAISPFNFPAMTPFWFIPFAIVTGNTFILKPSELVPMTADLSAHLIEKIGLPAGVFNLVHGDKVAGNSFIENPDVAGVSFVGKSATCVEIAAKCAAHKKRYQAMGSAKNHLVVMPDYVQMDELIRNMSTSCFGCAGQRCMASSAIVAVGDEMYEKVSTRFVEDAKNFITANPLDPKYANEPLLTGPVITAQAKDFIHKMIETGVKEGATLALDGRGIEVPGCEKGHFIGPTVFTDVKPGMEIHKTEIFGPVVVILKVDTLDEAIKIINEHQYSNACSIYTQNGYYARKFKLEVEPGMVGINVGIPAPVPFLPFGGSKYSMICDIKMQGQEAFRFYTHDRVVIERYWTED